MKLPYEIVYLGCEHPDYFQGFGTSFSRYEHSVYGIGSTVQDAYEDALEQMAQSTRPHMVVMPDLPDMCPLPYEREPLDDDDERYYHVGIRWVNCSIGELNPMDDSDDE